MTEKFKYFIHTNKKQELPAKISQYNSYKNFNSPKPKILVIEDFVDIEKFHNKTYLRNGIKTLWNKDDLQSFTFLRFIVPELSNYEGISIVTDPDVFLLKPFVQTIDKYKDNDLTVRRVINQMNPMKNYLESSIMIFKNEKFKFTNLDKILGLLFSHQLDYKDLIHLEYYKRNDIKIFEAHQEFNSFDKFNDKTEFLHTTNRVTQPWKTGLKIDFKKYKFDYGETSKWKVRLEDYKEKIKNTFFPKKYIPHPDKKIIDFFDSLFKSALKANHISRKEIIDNVSNNYISKKYLKYIGKK